MHPAKSRVMFTRMMEITLGRMCLKAIRFSLTPMDLAAMTNSFSRSANTCARIIRARPVQLSRPRIIMMMKILVFSSIGMVRMT
jgi:hypothetical protein